MADRQDQIKSFLKFSVSVHFGLSLCVISGTLLILSMLGTSRAKVFVIYHSAKTIVMSFNEKPKKSKKWLSNSKCLT